MPAYHPTPDPVSSCTSFGSSGPEGAGVRLAQVIHHGTDHRSQICTALTALGIEPPAIDVWDYASTEGRISETEPTVAT